MNNQIFHFSFLICHCGCNLEVQCVVIESEWPDLINSRASAFEFNTEPRAVATGSYTQVES
jgi:hypothetical protein